MLFRSSLHNPADEKLGLPDVDDGGIEDCGLVCAPGAVVFGVPEFGRTGVLGGRVGARRASGSKVAPLGADPLEAELLGGSTGEKLDVPAGVVGLSAVVLG